MRSWQPVIGVFLGFLLGKVLSMAIFWLPGLILAAGSLSGGGSFTLGLLSTLVLALVFAAAGAVWLFVNFFMISGWLAKATGASAIMSAVMMVYTTAVVLFCQILGWFGNLCSIPFWVVGWF